MVTGGAVGVSVLCPEFVNTRILDSERNRPADVSPMETPEPPPGGDVGDLRRRLEGLVVGGKDPAEVAGMVVDGIRRGRFWILTDETTLPTVRRRWDAIARDGQPPPWNLSEGPPVGPRG